MEIKAKYKLGQKIFYLKGIDIINFTVDEIKINNYSVTYKDYKSFNYSVCDIELFKTKKEAVQYAQQLIKNQDF